MFLTRTVPLARGCVLLPLVMIFIASPELRAAAKHITAEYDFKNYKIITPNRQLELKCTVDDTTSTFMWKKGGDDLSKDSDITNTVDGTQQISILKIPKATDENTGLYECIAKLNGTDSELKTSIDVVSLPTADLEVDVIVVEGEKLILDCRPTGKPAPNISWTIENMTYNNSTDRIMLKQSKDNISNAILQIDDVKMSDRGDYKCVASNIATVFKDSDVSASSKVRVKDKLAALWPFLGICAEVFVLCTIIFIYEKKRNKAELDESDTDNSPEQKNTPDHGKDSVRQRK